VRTLCIDQASAAAPARSARLTRPCPRDSPSTPAVPNRPALGGERRTRCPTPPATGAQVARDAGANVEAVEGFVQAIQLLKDGRVDATVNDTLAVGEYQKTNADAGIKIAGTTGDTSEQAFAARKDSGLIAEVNRALGELRADGTLKQISEKYFRSDVSAAA
jgi:L-cystine transport system substrate-binding protein